MPALSISTIAASDSASKAAGKPGMPGAGSTADGSPFAVLLAAISQQNGSQASATAAAPTANNTVTATNNNDTSAGKDVEPQTPIAPPTLPSPSVASPSLASPSLASPSPASSSLAPSSLVTPSPAPDDATVSKDSGKRDKKADDGNATDNNALVAAQLPPLPTAAPNIPSNLPVDVPANASGNVQPAAPANAPAPGIAGADTSLGAGAAASPNTGNNGGPAAQTGTINGVPNGNKSADASPTDPQPASQPAPVNGQSGPAVPNLAPALQLATTADNNSVANDAPPGIVSNIDKPAAQNKASDGQSAADKSAADKSATDKTKSISNPPVDLQTVSQPIPATDDDVEAAPQTVTIPPPVGADPTAPNSNGNSVTAAQLINAAPAQTGKPDTKNAGPADKPLQAAANTNTSPPAVNPPLPSPAKPVTTVPGKDNGNAAVAVQTTSNGIGDNKPVHAPAPDGPPPQPDAPIPVPQTAPAPVLPQTMATADFGVTAPAASADGGPVTTSLHIATADTDPTPNLGALAVSIAARSLSGAKQFDIRLDPPELGRVDVRLSIDASGKTQAHMTADQPQTLGLLQKDAPTLTQALRDAGLDVSQSGLNFSLRGQDRQNDSGGNGTGQGRRTNLTATRTIQATQSATAISFNGAAADARVDIHV